MNGGMEFSLARMVLELQPKLIVELGVGDGATAVQVMNALAADGRLIGINWPNPPSGDNPSRYLGPWLDDQRLTILYGDTRDAWVVASVPDGIELLHIDSTHSLACISDEWRLYEPKLANKATVVIDDLDVNDMRVFWDRLTGDKEVVYDGRVGILRYKR